MSNTGGYAVVDADDEIGGNGDIGGRGGNNQLQFQSFLGVENGRGQQSRSIEDDRQPAATVPFSPFNLTYYQSYFDVDTKTVLQRCFASFIPREGFIDDTCEQRVDLYGPFWGLTTLCLTIYLSSSLSNSIANYISRGSTDPTGVREQDLTLLSFIVTLIYLYGLAFPAAFWAVTRWLAIRSAGNEAGGGAEGVGWTLPEAWAIWGYAMVIWIPVSLLCIIPIPILRWILVGGAGISSGYFLVRNVYPILASIADTKLPRTLIVVVVALHAILTLTMKVAFFSFAVAGRTIGPNDPLSDTVGGIIGGGDEDIVEIVKRWLTL